MLAFTEIPHLELVRIVNYPSFRLAVNQNLDKRAAIVRDINCGF